jgi:gluconokinase
VDPLIENQISLIVVMGVSGVGKSTVGRALADRLDWPFVDGDDLHPSANLDKMRRGQPLTDADRAPWLEALGALIAEHAAAGQPLVLACSALKKAYREQLRRHGAEIRFVYLRGDFELIQKRLTARPDHYMPVELLQSQFDALEEPQNALVVDADQEVSEIVHAVLLGFNR